MFKAEWNQAPNILSRIQPPINMSSTVYILLLLTANFIFDESLKPQRPVKTGTALNFLEPGLTCIHNCRLSPSYSEVALCCSSRHKRTCRSSWMLLCRRFIWKAVSEQRLDPYDNIQTVTRLQVVRSSTSVFPQRAGVFLSGNPDSVNVEL